MGIYIFQPKNYIAPSYFTVRASSNNIVLCVHNSVQMQWVEIIELMTDMEKYKELFYPRAYIKLQERLALNARGPPCLLPQYCEVSYGMG